jgi:tetratricopeptide (TPR) repeat protein
MLCWHGIVFSWFRHCEVLLAQLRPAVHRTILAVDIESFSDSPRTTEHRTVVREGMYRALEQACTFAGIPWADCRREDRGDGMYLLAPAAIPKSRFVEDLPTALATELREHNRRLPVRSRIRLRMALHAGVIQLADRGATSAASILTFRIIEAPALRSALAESPADLAFIVSHSFFDDVVRHSARARVAAFREVTVTVKETSATAWIMVPDVRSSDPTIDVGANLSRDQFFTIVEALESIPCMSTESDRGLVIGLLRPAIASSIRYYAARRAHVVSILRACQDHEGGINDLLTAISMVEQPGSRSVRRLAELVGAPHSQRPLPEPRAARRPRVWGSVPLRNPDFVGREELLEELRQRLLDPGVASAVLPEALHGMGGVGKSQTVIEYIYRHASEYEVVWWIPAEHTTQIRTSLVELGKRLGVQTGSSSDAAVDSVLEALRSGEPYSRWILVFDNAERPDLVRPFLPAGFGHVVVTSRNSEWSWVAHTVKVDLFTRDESIELLRRRGGEITNNDADKLAEALGDLPLAVEQAASWRAQTGMPVVEYLRLLERNSVELLKAGATGGYELPVAAAWNVPLDRLRNDRREALELLQLCAFFGPEPIPRSMFTGFRNAPVASALREAAADPIRLNHAIGEISRYSLAKIDHRNNTVQLHRLVQAVLRDQVGPEQQGNLRHTVHLMLVSNDPDDPASATNWPHYAALLQHALSSRAVDCDEDWVRRLVNNLVRYLISAGDFRGALQLAEQAWQVRTDTLGERHLDAMLMDRFRGIALRRVGRVADAQVAITHTYELMLAALGEDHEASIGMADTMGFIFRVRGDLYGERDLAAVNLERARRVLGEEDPTTFTLANNLAGCYRLTGEYVKARTLDEHTVRRRIMILGDDHPATLNTLCGFAMDVRECGQYLQACEMQERTSLRMVELFGPDHPYTIGGKRCLAVARRRAGLYDQAMALTEDCYERYRRRQGEVHVDTATGLMDMMTELRHLGDLERSRKYGRLSLERFGQVYDDRHPFTLIAKTNLAVTYRLSGDMAEARRLNEQALAGLADKLHSDHPYALVAAANLASDLAELGEVDRAHRIDTATLERCTRILSEKHPSTLAVAHNLSMDLGLVGRTEEAAILHTRALAGFREVLGDDHPATLSAARNVRVNCDADTMQL